MAHEVIISSGFLPVKCDLNTLKRAALTKGENLFISGHVLKVEEVKNVVSGTSELRGLVLRQTSISKPPVTVLIKLDAGRNVVEQHCTCIAGVAGRCKHIAAVIIASSRECGMSKTSQPQAWGRPSQAGKAKYGKGKKMEEMFPPINPVYCSKLHPFQLETTAPSPYKAIADASSETDELRVASEVVQFLVEATVKMDDTRRYEAALVSLVPTVVSVPMLTLLPPKIEFVSFYNSRVSIGTDGCRQVALTTVAQSESAAWRTHRALRISASSDAHKLLRGRDVAKIADGIVFCSGPPKQLPSLVYGRKNESKAISEYCAKNSVQHVRPGLLIHPKQPYLCTSPDALILDALGQCSRLLEVKCPISCRQSEVVDEGSGAPKIKYITFESGVYRLRSTHQYYTQVQMQMYVSGTQTVHLYVYSPINTLTIEIPRDDPFLEIAVPKLTQAYFLHLLPQIVQKSGTLGDGLKSPTNAACE